MQGISIPERLLKEVPKFAEANLSAVQDLQIICESRTQHPQSHNRGQLMASQAVDAQTTGCAGCLSETSGRFCDT